MKKIIIAVFSFVILSVVGYGFWSYHASKANAAPPYICDGIHLLSAKQSADNNQRYYNFSGTCQVKVPQGNSWVYQAICVKIAAAWDRSRNTAVEITQFRFRKWRFGKFATSMSR